QDQRISVVMLAESPNGYSTSARSAQSAMLACIIRSWELIYSRDGYRRVCLAWRGNTRPIYLSLSLSGNLCVFWLSYRPHLITLRANAFGSSSGNRSCGTKGLRLLMPHSRVIDFTTSFTRGDIWPAS